MEIPASDSRWFSARILPYRTVDDVIDGVVITFMDTSDARRLEAQLRGSHARFGALLEHLPPGLAVVDGCGRALAREAVLEAIASAAPNDLATWRVVVTAGGEQTGGAAP